MYCGLGIGYRYYHQVCKFNLHPTVLCRPFRLNPLLLSFIPHYYSSFASHDYPRHFLPLPWQPCPAQNFLDLEHFLLS